HVHSSSLFFFFFQAEDGIRDFHVTGVQTCALPISLGRQPGLLQHPLLRRLQPRQLFTGLDAGIKGARLVATKGTQMGEPDRKARSEERRVGKECRTRWWPED